MNDRITGFAFPFRIDPARGGVARASGDDKLRQNLIQLLLTGPGERVMRRDYGGGLRQLVHDPNNDALRAIVQHQVAKAIGRFETRILLQDIQVALEDATLIVSIQYVVRRTRQVQKLSLPIAIE